MEILKTEGFENIYEVERFQKEWLKITNGNHRYPDWLFSRLKELDDLGKDALDFESFEVLSTSPKLYGIRYSHSKLNPRVIFVFTNGNRILLLKPFKESSKSSNSDYKIAIKTARNRLRLQEDTYYL